MNKIKYIITLFLVVLFFNEKDMKAQQDVQFTQYFWNTLMINSGYAGSHDHASVSLIVRNQWTGLDGRPQSKAFSFHTPLKNEKLAVGFGIITDELGPSEETTLAGDFAYRLQVNEESRLAFGVKASVDFFKAGLQGLTGTLDDPAFEENVASNAQPNFGASAYYWADNYFLGISMPNFLENDLAKDPMVPQGIEKRHFYVMGGYVFDVSPLLKFKPTALAKTAPNAPASIDITGNFLYDERLWLGLAYRTEDSWDANISYLFTPMLRAGFAWDFTLSDIQDINDGSWEIMLGYDFNFKKEKLMSPRYF